MHDDLFSFLDGPPATFEFAHIDGFGRTDRAHDASATRPSWFDCRIVGSQTKQRTPASVPRRIVRWPDGIRHAAMRTRSPRHAAYCGRGVIPGDKVTLSSATMTDAEMQSGTPNVADMPNGTETPSGMANDMPDGGVDAQLRTICAEALLTGKPAKDAQGNTIAVFAMPPNAAAVVLRVQEYSAVIATIN